MKFIDCSDCQARGEIRVSHTIHLFGEVSEYRKCRSCLGSGKVRNKTRSNTLLLSENQGSGGKAILP